MAQQAKKKQAATDASSEAPVQPFSTRHPSLLGLAFPPLAAHLALLSLPPLFGFSPSNTYTHVHVLAASIPFLTLLPRSSETGLLVTHGLLAACCALWFHYLRLIGSWSNELGVVTGPLVAWAGVGVLGSIVVRDSVVRSGLVWGQSRREAVEAHAPPPLLFAERPPPVRPPQTFVNNRLARVQDRRSHPLRECLLPRSGGMGAVRDHRGRQDRESFPLFRSASFLLNLTALYLRADCHP